MSDFPVVLLVSMEAKPDRADEMRATLLEAVRASHAEDGCLIYQMLEDPKTPGQFMLLEKWRDRAAFKSHQSAEHLARTFGKLESLQARPPEFTAWRAVD